jgi:23S rRNA pseudouridine1911/1915/1917 synthase
MKENTKFEILFEDDYLVAINKPPGLLVIPDRFKKLEENIHDILQKEYNDIFTLHRLDKETSGVILFAKDAETHKHLNTQFEQHKVHKTYLVLVKGNISENEGTIDAPLAKRSSNENVMIVDKRNGKASVTKFKVIKRFSKFTLVEAYPQTGRTHQIRVHFKSINHPLAIDKLYSNTEKIFLSDIKSKFKPSNDIEKPLMERLTLHAQSIEFIHPKTFQKMRIDAPLFKDYKITIKNLEKYSS